MHLKHPFLFLATLLFTTSLKAQTGYNFYGYGIGFGASASYVRASTSIPVEYNHAAFSLNLTYNYNPYIPIEAEIQFGTLSGGGLTSNLDSLGRQYVNHYKALIIHSDLQLGAIMNYGNNKFLNIAKNLFIGSGIGLLSNTDIVQRYKINSPTYKFPGDESSIDAMIPIRVGYEIKIFNKDDEPSIAIDICYIKNIVLGHGINGYYDPNSKFNYNGIDSYRQLTVSFKYFIGKIVSYKKLIRPISFDK